MKLELIKAVLLLWPLLVVLMFRTCGPRRAVLLAVIGGFLLLPPAQLKLHLPGFDFPLDKWNVNGVAMLAGCLLFGRRSPLPGRLHWVDLPIAAWYLAPLIGLVTGVTGAAADIGDLMIGRGLGWVVPYALARLYFSDRDGPSDVAFALVLGGLVYVPICIYEQLAGPGNYLATQIYGIPHSGNVDRLGGWRPNGFLGDGLVLASWMAMTAVTATWLWLGRVRSSRLQSGIIALLLVLVTLSCRGVYGYLLLAAGLITAALTSWRHSRIWLICLAGVPVLYIGLRISGAWDGSILLNGADFAGRSGTVAFRLMAENEIISRVMGSHPLFGFGSYVWSANHEHFPDGGWLHALWMGGCVGIALWLVAMSLAPVAAALSRRQAGSGDMPRQFAAWSLACWCALQSQDMLHNTSYMPPLSLVVGALMGYAVWKPVRASGRTNPKTAPPAVVQTAAQSGWCDR